MFGLLRPDFQRLDPRLRREYQRSYCNLCGCLGRQYGLKSRMLLVYDFATMDWLFGTSADRPYRRLNCLSGGALTTRNMARPADRFLAALSTFACGIKVDDDQEDEPSWRNRLASTVYRGKFARARDDLAAAEFNLDMIDTLLMEQRALEARHESDLHEASQPTGAAYSLSVEHLVRLTDADVEPSVASRLAEILGRCVYLVDSFRDCPTDEGRSYNPLCCADGNVLPRTSVSRRRELIVYVSQLLRDAESLVAERAGSLADRWSSVDRRIRRLLGIDKRSTVLNVTCCMPCGDAVIACDGADCDECCKGCCGLVCCGVCCYACT